MDYPKWKGEGFLEFFDDKTYHIWDKNTEFPNNFKDILLRTLRNRIIIPSNILGSATRFEIPQSNIVDPIRKQLLDLIDGEIVLWTFFNLENFKSFYLFILFYMFA